MRVTVLVVSVADAATRLNLSPHRVRQLIREGRLPAQQVGREYCILAPDLEHFAARERPPGRPKR